MSVPTTVRSKELKRLVPTVRSAVDQVRLSPEVAEDAVQRALVTLTPHIELLASMRAREHAAYVWKTATHVALRIRREQGLLVKLAKETSST